MPKQTLILLSVVLFAGAGFLYLFPGEQPQTAAAVIIMKDLKYSETEIAIKQGETIEFINSGESGEEYWPASNIHPSHGIYPEFDSQQPVKAGESWSFKFDRIGSWRFHDHIHFKEIKGVITVL